MPDPQVLPPAVVLGLWVNAAKSGLVSHTDAANALETITDQVEINQAADISGSAPTPWMDLVTYANNQLDPVAVALPIEGDPSGVPAWLLSRLEPSSGVIALDNSALLVNHKDYGWSKVVCEHAVNHQDFNFARSQMMRSLVEVTQTLSEVDMIGDALLVEESLKQAILPKLPPAVSEKHFESIELSLRVQVIATSAMRNSSVVASPSLDTVRIIALKRLQEDARKLMQSAVTFR